MKKGIAFKRVSTSKQDNKTQSEVINLFIKGFNVKIVKEFEEQISGSTKIKERPILQEAIKYVKENDIKYVAIAELSRLGRTNEILQVIKEWGEQGVSVLMAKEQRATLDATGKIEPTMQFTISVLTAINEYELTTINHRISRGVQHSIISKGHRSGKNPPYGYQIINKKLVVNPDEEGIIKEVFDLYHKHNWGALKISNYLTQKGYKTRKGKDWDYTTVQGMIRNTLYKGVQIYKEQEILREELKIIDPIIFNACQNRIHKNKNYIKTNQKHTYLYDKRIMKCGICCKHFIARSSKKLINTKGYYMCYQNKHGGKCANKPVNITSFENYMSKYLLEHWDNLIKENDGRNKNKEKVTDEIKLLKKQVDKHMTAKKRVTLTFEMGERTEEEYKERVVSLNNTIKELNDKINELDASLNTQITLRDLLKEQMNTPLPSVIDNTKFEFTPISKETLHTIIKEIVVHIDHVEINLINEKTFSIDRNLLKGRKKKNRPFEAIAKHLFNVKVEGSIDLPNKI